MTEEKSDSIETHNKVGRPPFKPTKAQRDDVALMKACGETEGAIAALLGISIPTLRLHFSDELVTGRAKFRRELFSKLKKLADEGNVTALKFLVTQGNEGGSGQEPDLGKKEAARLAAKNPEPGTPLGDLMRKRQAPLPPEDVRGTSIHGGFGFGGLSN